MFLFRHLQHLSVTGAPQDMLKLMVFVSIGTIDVITSAHVTALPVEYNTVNIKATEIEIKDVSEDNDKTIKIEAEFKTKMRDTSVLQPATTFEDLSFSAFSGDSCPTGKAKIHGVCAETD